MVAVATASSENLKGPSMSIVSYTFDDVSISILVSSTIARTCTHLEFRRNIAQEMTFPASSAREVGGERMDEHDLYRDTVEREIPSPKTSRYQPSLRSRGWISGSLS